MNRVLAAIAIACVGLTTTAATCSTAPPEISAEHAVAIARTHATFEVASITTEKAADEGRRVWRVTLRGKPASPEHPLLRPIVIVSIDRRSGEVISVATS